MLSKSGSEIGRKNIIGLTKKLNVDGLWLMTTVQNEVRKVNRVNKLII